MDISKTTILLIAALMTGVAIYLFSDETRHPQPETKITSKEVSPSAFIENGNFRIYDKEGYATELSSKEAVFYHEENYLEIESPSIKLTSAQGNEFHLSSDQGVYYPKKETLALKGNVQVIQTKPSENSWSLYGHDFLLDNNLRFISSKQAVTITKDNHTMQAIGLSAWIDEKRIELLSKVRGQYVF